MAKSGKSQNLGRRLVDGRLKELSSVSSRDLRRACALYARNEPRDLFYRAATELVERALRGRSGLSVAEALAVLLRTWNKELYRFRKFDSADFDNLERVYQKHKRTLSRCRKRTIANLGDKDQATVATVFRDFENVLYPVGAAKALHLLAPNLFPLWDRTIAKAYGLSLGKTGTNAERYWCFMARVKAQYLQCKNVTLKAIDEFNYCKYTKGWL